MITHILFDFDGTLMDTNDLILESLQASSEKFRGRPIDDFEMASILGKPLADQMHELDPVNAMAMDAFYRDYYLERRDTLTKEFEGVRDMLQAFQGMGMKMGIVSNKEGAGILHGLKHFELEAFFETYISTDDVEKGKPDPQGIFKALKRLNGNPDQTLFIGDNSHDIESGKNAGVKTVLVGWSILNRDSLMKAGPDYVAETPAEICELVKGLI